MARWRNRPATSARLSARERNSKRPIRAVPRPCADGAGELRRAFVPTRARSGSAIRSPRTRARHRGAGDGLPLDKVIVHNHLIGGGFGRRLEVDYIGEQTVRIAQKVDGPVKIIWTREEDIQQALYRPFYFDRFAASLSNGKIAAWSHRIAGSSIMARWLPPAFKDGVDVDAVDGAIDVPYDTPNIHVEYVHAEPPGVPTCFWRSVGPGAYLLDTSRVLSTSWRMRRAGSRRLPAGASHEGAAVARLPRSRDRKRRAGEARFPRGLDAASPARACSALCRGDHGRGRRRQLVRSAA